MLYSVLENDVLENALGSQLGTLLYNVIGDALGNLLDSVIGNAFKNVLDSFLDYYIRKCIRECIL